MPLNSVKTQSLSSLKYCLQKDVDVSDDRFYSERFPLASKYHPEWILAGASGGANPLWLTEWLCEKMELQPGMKVLDLGCGRAMSSIFLHREFGVQVWAADLWFSASENIQRVRDAKAENGVFPIRSDARTLPFSEDFFDAIIAIDSFMFFGTDDLYLNYLARFVKPGGRVGIAQAGFLNEMGDQVPEHMANWWKAEHPYCLHSPDWWRNHWQRSWILNVETADSLEDGWRYWLEWLSIMAPDNQDEIGAIKTDEGRNFGYVRAIGRRRPEAELFDPSFSLPADYTSKPMLREAE